jgi:hypothetical protein
MRRRAEAEHARIKLFNRVLEESPAADCVRGCAGYLGFAEQGLGSTGSKTDALSPAVEYRVDAAPAGDVLRHGSSSKGQELKPSLNRLRPRRRQTMAQCTRSSTSRLIFQGHVQFITFPASAW